METRAPVVLVLIEAAISSLTSSTARSSTNSQKRPAEPAGRHRRASERPAGRLRLGGRWSGSRPQAANSDGVSRRRVSLAFGLRSRHLPPCMRLTRGAWLGGAGVRACLTGYRGGAMGNSGGRGGRTRRWAGGGCGGYHGDVGRRGLGSGGRGRTDTGPEQLLVVGRCRWGRIF
jgi:hypothetical protein